MLFICQVIGEHVDGHFVRTKTEKSINSSQLFSMLLFLLISIREHETLDIVNKEAFICYALTSAAPF